MPQPRLSWSLKNTDAAVMDKRAETAEQETERGELVTFEYAVE